MLPVDVGGIVADMSDNVRSGVYSNTNSARAVE